MTDTPEPSTPGHAGYHDAVRKGAQLHQNSAPGRGIPAHHRAQAPRDAEASSGVRNDAVRIGATIVDQLIRNGVREAVVCPGSRNSALALALAEADRTHRLRLHVRTDERTAAFLALGLAKTSRMLVPVVMTSGTAVANCLPAMVEASMSGVPLMVLSANRPLTMLGTGANQTIDQAQIFGSHSKATFNTERFLVSQAIDPVGSVAEGAEAGRAGAGEGVGADTGAGGAGAGQIGTCAAAGADTDAAGADTDAGAGAGAGADTDAGAAGAGEGADMTALRALINQAVGAALNPLNPGGVHVDVPLEDPLVPWDTDSLSLLAQQIAGAGTGGAGAGQIAGADTDAVAGTGAGAGVGAGGARTNGSHTPINGAQLATKGPQHRGPRPLPFGEVTVDLSKRTLVIAGSSADEAWARSIRDELADVPTIAEPIAAAPVFPVHSAAIGMFTAGLVAQGEYSAMTRPEQIILVGRPTLHRAVTELLADPEIAVTVLTDVKSYPRLGPTSDQASVTGQEPAANAPHGQGSANITQVGSRIRLVNESPTEWLQVCQGISDMGVDAVREALAPTTLTAPTPTSTPTTPTSTPTTPTSTPTTPTSTPTTPTSTPATPTHTTTPNTNANPATPTPNTTPVFSAIHATAVVADNLSDGDLVVIGASSAIRDASRAGMPFDGVRALANRGASGIDGTVSTAIGAALAHSATDPTAMRAPRTVAVMGDLTFLHDATALNIGPGEPRPSNLLIVVVNDNGGGIFETLEPGRDSLRTFGDGTPAFERVFATPTDADIEHLCRAFNVDYQRATTMQELALAVENHEEAGGDGIVVVEAVVDRAGRVVVEGLIRARVNPQR